MKQRIMAAVTLAAALLIGLPAAPAHASTTVNVSADTYWDRAAPDTNFGTATSIASGVPWCCPTSPRYVSFLRFNLPSQVPSATLTLHVSTVIGGGSATFFRVVQATNGWTETGLTYNNGPTLGTTSLGVFQGAPRAATITVPLDHLDGLAGQQVTLAITPVTTTVNDDLWLWSREQFGLGATLTVGP